MKQELILKKCNKCGCLIEVLKNCNCKDCGIICCNEPMKTLIENDKEASFEKHIPTYEIKENKLIIKVNHVMESDHYIEWIMVKGKNNSYKKEFTPEETPELIYDYEEQVTIYSYCNKHGLWKIEVE